MVSSSDAARIPYPWVYVNLDGTVRELHPKEREYLQTPFHPTDGARPYIKLKYHDKNGWGEIQGFCQRSAIPQQLPVADAPSESPIKTMTGIEFVNALRERAAILRPTTSTTPVKRPWWKFWA